MSLEWEQIVVDAAQPAALGRWWANALGWVVTFEADDEFEISPLRSDFRVWSSCK